jgi:hypothetical protein
MNMKNMKKADSETPLLYTDLMGFAHAFDAAYSGARIRDFTELDI